MRLRSHQNGAWAWSRAMICACPVAGVAVPHSVLQTLQSAPPSIEQATAARPQTRRTCSEKTRATLQALLRSEYVRASQLQASRS
eukprot:CAMPEP_0119350574 /NCGR_PEP_ID=MMETSP1333-20130426/110128_1 /TAXON_ID=418940 /ORGANISM="Scyphosphaera apsteinii, Strain RCC1455" /LENGTH=84 /DNA_ID=CAMNT_0007363191 /DNA_START=241 /DNA_END=495 /DNA_ORIENTATION=+